MKHHYLLCCLVLPLVALGQNVGIGTTAPTQALDVNGNLRVRGAAGTGSGRLLGVAADGTLQAQSSPYGAPAAATPQAPVSLGTVAAGTIPSGVAVNPAGTRAYVVNYNDNTLQTFDLTGSAPVSLGTVGTGNHPSGVAISPAGTRAYVTNSVDNTLQMFDLTGNMPASLGTVATGNQPHGVAINPAGTRAYVANINTNTLQTFDLTGSAPVSLGTVAAGNRPSGVAVNPAGTRVYIVNNGDNTLQTFDLTGSVPVSLGTVATGEGPFGVAISPAGTRAYVGNFDYDMLQTFDLTGSTPVSLGTVAVDGKPTSVAVNPAGTRAYVVTYGNKLQIFVIGVSPRLVAVGADGTLGSVDPTTLPGDNLGTHTATRQLMLASQGLKFSDGTTQTTASALTLSGQTLGLSGGNTVTLPTQPGDNLGTHTATQALNLNGNNLTNGNTLAAVSVTASTSATTPAVLTPTTGAHNMLAVAYGSIGSTSPTPFASSGNFSFSHAAGSGVYVITFTSANLASASLGNAPVLVSLFGAAAPGLITWAGGTGTVTVYTYAAGGAAADRGFSFAVFLP